MKKISFSCFSSVLKFHRTRTLLYQENQCPIAYTEALQYWGIDESFIDPSCRELFRSKKDELDDHLEETIVWDENAQNRLWQMMEKPASSIGAKV